MATDLGLGGLGTIVPVIASKAEKSGESVFIGFHRRLVCSGVNILPAKANP